MTKPKSTEKGARLGVRMRGALQPSYEKRGASQLHLGFTFSLKMHQDVVIGGKMRFIHFLLAEADPKVCKIQYSGPYAWLGANDNNDVGFHALALLDDGCIEVRRLQWGAVVETKSQRESLDSAIILLEKFPSLPLGEFRSVRSKVIDVNQAYVENTRLVQNWNRLLPWYAQARYHSLAQAKREFDAILRDLGEVSLLELHKSTSKSSHPALLVAAAVRSVATGDCESNLASVVLGGHTRFLVKDKK